VDLPLDSLFRRFTLPLPGRGPGDLNILEFGPEDAPVAGLFLHANGFNAQTYARLLSPLASQSRILAYDQRGHGGTTLPANPKGRRDWLDLRDDLLALMTSFDLQDVALFGHSMGGTVSLLAAAQEPERAPRLVLLDPVMVSGRARAEAAESPMVAAALRRRSVFANRTQAVVAYRGRGAFATWPDDVLEDYVEAGFRPQPDGTVALACTPQWEASNYAAQAHDPWSALRAYPGAVEILAAEMDSTCREPEDLDIAALSPRVSITRLVGTTHFLPMERPDVVARSLARALDPSA
jgi:pimeloyl-ACP methyl ester carboxylesterase